MRLRGAHVRGKMIAYRWKRGEELLARDLGLPDTPAGYSMCFYDDDAGTAALVGQLAIPAGNGRWRRKINRTFYHDPTGSNSGVNRVKVRPGVAGRSVVTLMGRSNDLTIPDAATADSFFYSEPGVTVQFLSSMGVCTESRFVLIKRNTGTEFVGVDK
jgi:hypothetical protein